MLRWFISYQQNAVRQMQPSPPPQCLLLQCKPCHLLEKTDARMVGSRKKSIPVNGTCPLLVQRQDTEGGIPWAFQIPAVRGDDLSAESRLDCRLFFSAFLSGEHTKGWRTVCESQDAERWGVLISAMQKYYWSFFKHALWCSKGNSVIQQHFATLDLQVLF